MKIKFLAVAMIGFASTSALASEAGTTYAGLHFAKATYEDDLGLEADPTVAIARFGYFLTDYVAIEGRAGVGLADDEIEWDGYSTDATAEIDHLFGAYGVAHLPLNDAASLYALAGFTKGEATARAGSYSESASDTGFSYGFGGQINFTPSVSGTVEYTSYLDETDYEITAISAGFNYNF